MENEKTPLFKGKRRWRPTTPYGWNAYPFDALFGHGCVASHMTSDPPGGIGVTGLGLRLDLTAFVAGASVIEPHSDNDIFTLNASSISFLAYLGISFSHDIIECWKNYCYMYIGSPKNSGTLNFRYFDILKNIAFADFIR